jgi:hypothetical protein
MEKGDFIASVFLQKGFTFSGQCVMMYVVEDGFSPFSPPNDPNIQVFPVENLFAGGFLHNGKKSSVCRDCAA